MSEFAIAEFSKLVVQKVRDVAIQECDRFGKSQSVAAKRWREAMNKGTPESFAKEIIPDIVDATICALLYAIDDQLLSLSFTASNGETINLGSATDGLCGWYGPGTKDGWIAQHSKERFSRDLFDLDDMFSNG